MAIQSTRAVRQLNINQREKLDIFDKLASGKRITKASDDAAGLAIASQLEAAVRSLGAAQRNVSDVQSVVEINDAALEQVGNIGSRLKELATQSANGTLSDDQRTALNQEYNQLTQEAQRIAATTQFNGINTLQGDSVTAQVGISSDPNSSITVPGVNVTSIVSGVASSNISTQAAAQSALGTIDSFITSISSSRGELGGASKRIEIAGNNIAVERENSAAAESRIRDLDYAETLARKSSADIRSNAATAIVAQANLSEKLVLKLLS